MIKIQISKSVESQFQAYYSDMTGCILEDEMRFSSPIIVITHSDGKKVLYKGRTVSPHILHTFLKRILIKSFGVICK